MANSARFWAQCPKCHRNRFQQGHSSLDLCKLLKSGAEIKAYCITCDQMWLISEKERAVLERALAGPGSKDG